MMKKLLKICEIVYGVCLCATTALAATVTPASATNYYFSTPLRPGAIRGEVMVSTPTYYVPRSEDIDWIAEAYGERAALNGSYSRPGSSTFLLPSFGTWDLAETNRFYKYVTAVDPAGVTNIVIGYNLVTNSPPSGYSPGPYLGSGVRAGTLASYLWNPTADRHSFLEPSAQLVEDARVFEGGSHYYTNVYYVSGFDFSETNAASVVEMPMTNGTVSVYTNKWYEPVNTPVSTPFTNVIGYLIIDFCHTGVGIFPCYTNVPPMTPAYHSMPEVLSNDYAAVRGAVRLADFESDLNTYPTPEFRLSRTYLDGAEEPPLRTNRNYTSKYYYSFSGTGLQWWDGDSQTYIPHTEVEERYTLPLAHNTTLVTRFSPWAVTTGGVERVSVEAAYVEAECFYGPPSQSGLSDQFYAVLRVDAPERLTVTPSNTCVTVTLNARNLADRAFSAAGKPAIPQDLTAYELDPDYAESWSFDAHYFILIYRIHPTTKFDDW